MGTISMPQGRGSRMHNMRLYNEYGKKIPENIDQSRTQDNIVFVDKTIDEAYHEAFDKALDRYNAKQTRKDRMKSDYLSEIEHSGNGEKVFYEDVLQWGSMEDFKNPENREKAIEALTQYINSWNERNKNLFLIGAYLHLDEASPHLHIDYVPIAHGYSRGLDTRNSLNKALKEQGIEVSEERKKTFIDEKTGKETEVTFTTECKENTLTMAWKDREREYFADICRGVGLEVDQEKQGRGYSLSPQEYKVAKERMKSDVLKQLEEEQETLEEQQAEISSNIKAVKEGGIYADEDIFLKIPEGGLNQMVADKVEKAEKDAQDLLETANRKFDVMLSEVDIALENKKLEIDLEADEYRERKFKQVDKQVEEKQSELDRVTTAYDNKSQNLTAADLELTRVNTEAARQKSLIATLKAKAKAIADTLKDSFLQLKAVARGLIRDVISYTRAEVVKSLDERGLLNCDRTEALNKAIAPYDIHERYKFHTPNIEEQLVEELLSTQDEALDNELINDTPNLGEGR